MIRFLLVHAFLLTDPGAQHDIHFETGILLQPLIAFTTLEACGELWRKYANFNPIADKDFSSVFEFTVGSNIVIRMFILRNEIASINPDSRMSLAVTF